MVQPMAMILVAKQLDNATARKMWKGLSVTLAVMDIMTLIQDVHVSIEILKNCFH